MNKRYPWDRLKKPGDSFKWRRTDERSVRSQANKQGNRRGVVYRVEVTGPDWLRVVYLHGLLASPAELPESAIAAPGRRGARPPQRPSA